MADGVSLVHAADDAGDHLLHVAGRDGGEVDVDCVDGVELLRPGGLERAGWVGFVVLQWLSFADDVTAGRSVVVALCLFTFHACLALMAVTPHSAVIGRAVIQRWLGRGAVVAIATLAVWGLVVVFDRREPSGSTPLTLLGLLAVAAAVLALRHRSLGQPSARE